MSISGLFVRRLDKMQLNPYLNFNGQCEAAFRFYEKCLGGKIVEMLTHGGSPIADQIPKEMHDRILHARLTIGDKVLMGSDCPAGQYDAPKGFAVTLGIGNPTEAERVFHALAENGSVQMPIQKTFWAIRFGMLTDQFGTPWMINCEHAA